MKEKANVILVDDDTDFLEINRHILEAAGYAVTCFSDPDKAMRHMETEKPDLLITDLMMNSLASGFLLAQRLRADARFQTIPIILITAIHRCRGFDFCPRNDEELRAMHLDAYFEKPVPPKALLAKVQELLNKKEHDA